MYLSSRQKFCTDIHKTNRVKTCLHYEFLFISTARKRFGWGKKYSWASFCPSFFSTLTLCWGSIVPLSGEWLFFFGIDVLLFYLKIVFHLLAKKGGTPSLSPQPTLLVLSQGPQPCKENGGKALFKSYKKQKIF